MLEKSTKIILNMNIRNIKNSRYVLEVYREEVIIFIANFIIEIENQKCSINFPFLKLCQTYYILEFKLHQKF